MYARIISETMDAARACAGWILFPFALVLTIVAVLFTREG
jgi:hypothetical protein